MSRSLYHHLHIVIPRTFCKFSETHQLLNLTHISGIRKASRTTCIPQRNCHIMFLTDFKNFIIIFIERIFLSGHRHPCKYQAAATAYDIHLSFVFFDLVNCFSCNSTMQCHKIHTIFCMHAHNINKILCCQCCQISLIMNHTVINRNCTDHCRAFAGKLTAKRLRISMTGQIHNRLCSHIYRTHYFLHFDIIIFAVSRHTKIDIYFRAKHTSHAFRIQ